MDDRRGDVQLEPCTALDVPISQQLPKLTCFLILSRSLVQPSQRMFSSVSHAVKILSVSIPCDYTDKKFMKQNLDPRQKAWISNVYSEM